MFKKNDIIYRKEYRKGDLHIDDIEDIDLSFDDESDVLPDITDIVNNEASKSQSISQKKETPLDIALNMMEDSLDQLIEEKPQKSKTKITKKKIEFDKILEHREKLITDYNDHHVNVISKSETRKKWALKVDIDYSFADKGFNCASVHGPLSSSVFHRAFTFEDISLFLKLSDCGKVHVCVLDVDETLFDRCERPVPDTESQLPFGSYRNELYTTLLAPVNVCINAEQREAEADVTLMRNFEWKMKSFEGSGTLGIHVPVQSRLRIMDLKLTGGSLFAPGFAQDLTIRNNALTLFYQDYSDLYDFFARGILAPKGLTFDSRQRKTGFGDVSLFGMLDFAQPYKRLDSCQFGINLVLPSGGTLKSDKVWELYLGNGGAFQADFFANIWFNISQRIVPSIRAAVELSAPFTTFYRVPQCKTNLTEIQAKNIDNLLVPGPSVFTDYFVMAYQDLDTTIPYFADEAVSTRVKWGTKWLIGFTSYFNDVFIDNFRLGLFYDYSGKTKDGYCPRRCDKIFCPKVLQDYTDEQAHRIGWSLAYSFKNDAELSFGSQHIIAGKNVAQTHDIFASLVIIF